MELGVTLGQRQEQRLLLLPKMLLAIEILRLSTRDLLAMIESELAENETLEIDVPADGTEPAQPAAASNDERYDFLQQVAAHNLSLHAHLLGQLAVLELPGSVREIVSFLIGSLDGNGHLLLEPGEIATFFPVRAPVGEAIRALRSLEPRGVGASGPLESMLAQIDPEDPDHDYLAAILRSWLDDLAKNRLPKVARELGVSVPDLKLLIGKLRGLDPCPGRAFQAGEPDAVHPDVVVRREDEEWQVYVDDARVPKLSISDDYHALAQDRAAPRRLRSYLEKKLGSARDLLYAIEQRKETLGRVARAVIERQAGFLERGLAGLSPLKMQEVADAIGVHLSTVSRAAADKYIQTDFGVFPLRRLFDGGKGVGGDARGRGGLSRTSVKEHIRRVIAAEEPKHPLSDDDIVARLAEDGVTVARRTVAKYRKELGIPSSFRRREH